MFRDRSRISGETDVQIQYEGRRLGHQKALDGVRGIAVLGVVAFHARIPGFHGGGAGVLVFFVLSGFLITTLLCEEYRARSRIDFRRFYVRRALRLFPALGAVLVVCLLGAWLFLHGVERHRLLVEVASSAGYVTDWVLATKKAFPVGAYLEHTWSLSVEEQFYVVWPLMLLGLLRVPWSWRTRIGLVIGGAAVSAGWRAILDQSHHSNHAAYGLDTNAMSLLAGCALGLAFTSGMKLPIRPWLTGAAIAFLALECVRGDLLPLRYGLLEIGVTVATVIVIGQLVTGTSPLSTALSYGPLVYVGLISYGLYLWHYPVFAVINSRHLPHWSSSELLITKLVLSVALTLVSYYAIERPCLRLKDRFASSKPRQPASAA